MTETSYGTGWGPKGTGFSQENPPRPSREEARKRWGEYRTDEPNAHGGYGNTDGLSRFRQNVDLCHAKRARTDFEENAGYMYPPALVKYDMIQETRTSHNRSRRVKQDNVFSVFPLNDPERTDAQGNKVLTKATREAIASNTDRFHRTTRNQRIYKDHTSEIRRRVAEKLKKKRFLELKEALRTLAVVEPTPENLARYREICELDIDEDGESSKEQSKVKEEFLKRLDQSMVISHKGEQTSTSATSGPFIGKPFHLTEAQNDWEGVMRQPENASNMFARPWADPRLVYALATWEPLRKCHPRACRRVRFKDEIYDIPEDDLEPHQNTSDNIIESKSIDDKIDREFEEPENLYYDENVCTNIASRLAIPFKTEACKRFHQKYPDPLPDLRTYHTFAKKHFFDGLHTSVFRG